MQVLTKLIVHALPWIPRPIIRAVAGRYIAGETLSEAVRVVKDLHAAGLHATVDVLGENETSEEGVKRGVDEYLSLVDALAVVGFPSQISVKPTFLGLRISEDLASRSLEAIVAKAEEKQVSVFVDMEDSTTTDATLRMFERLRREHPMVGVAIQAYLKRSPRDVEALLPLRPAIRICKGIYQESPEVALKDRGAIQESYMKLATMIVDEGGYPAMATHDPVLVDRCLSLVTSRRLAPASYEFQMLLGVGESLRPRLLREGAPLRLYCPYGPHWYAYSLRRLKENPKMVGYIVRNLFSRRAAHRR